MTETPLNSSPGEITRLLLQWKQGEPDAFDRLVPLVYPQLRRIAAAYIRMEKDPGGLQATALVHEVYLRLTGRKTEALEDRAHFYAFAARVMRRILMDYARSGDTQKRGGGTEFVPLNEQIPWVQIGGESMVQLNRALDDLEAIDPQKARLVELRFFLGCTAEEAGEILQISKATVDREVKFAKGWLYRRIVGEPERPRGKP
ncbi:MAG: sigma-70 family RNA polymerase sigma factor [Bryobacteraceae bacterium]